jgi:Na+/phosphate symporter
MTNKICGHENKCNDVCEILDKVSHDMEMMTSKVFDGLLKHNRKSLKEAEEIGATIEQEAKRLTELVLSAKNEEMKLDSVIINLGISSGLQKMKYSNDKIIASIRTKADDGVLFSDKAVMELKDFFTVIIDGLKQIHDLILTNNHVLVTYIVSKAEAYEEVGRRYAEEHQDRLIKGICLPKSSLLYLLILESLKDILWDIKGIALAFKEK